jgi:hypothetical protein
MIDRKRGLGARPRLVGQSLDLLGRQVFESFRRPRMHRRLRHGRRRQQHGSEQRNTYCMSLHPDLPNLYFRSA